jgi:hypothetical protein
MEILGETDTILFGMAEGFLEQTETATEPWDGEGHAPKLTQDLVPFLEGDTFLGARKGV